MDRRTFLSATAVAAATPLVGVAAAQAAPAPATNSQPRPDQIARAVAEARLALNFDGTRFSGPAYDWLLNRASGAQAFLLGEEHGISENARLAAQLFIDLAPRGYRHLAIETSPPMASALETALAEGGASALKRLITTPESRVAFFGLREEAELLAAAHAAVSGRPGLLWGMDYEIGADRYLIERLKAADKPAVARKALAELEKASKTSWDAYDKTRNPQHIFSFSGDPALVQAVQRAWPSADTSQRLTLNTLEETFAINRLWTENKGYESNLRRSRLMRSNFLHYWGVRERHDPQSRIFMKMGASHMVRGASMTDVFDLGTFVPDLLASEGGSAFHLLVLPGPGTQTANLDPTKFLYLPGNRDEYGEGMDIFDKAVLADTFTLFDTVPLRPLASSHSGGVPLPLWRVIHGFDAVLILTGSTPSSNI